MVGGGPDGGCTYLLLVGVAVPLVGAVVMAATPWMPSYVNVPGGDRHHDMEAGNQKQRINVALFEINAGSPKLRESVAENTEIRGQSKKVFLDLGHVEKCGFLHSVQHVSNIGWTIIK